MTPAPGPRTYFVNLPVDLAVMGGLSTLLYVVLWLTGAAARSSTVIALGATLVWIINYPHFSATSHRLYRSREHLQQFPVTAFAVPLLLLVGIVLSLERPDDVAPTFVKFFQIWSPYHFSGQTFGIGMLYARRAGIAFGRLERTLLRWFIFSTYLSLVATVETGLRQYQFFGVTYPALGLPPALAEWMTLAMYGLGLLVVSVLVVRPVLRQQPVAWMTLVPATTQFVWFGLGQRVPSFAEFIPAFHSAQYLLVAWSVHVKVRLDEEGVGGSPSFASTESAAWLMTNFLGGFALFWLLPRLATWIGGYDLGVSTAVLFSAVQIHHFFVDGVIWKLRNPRVLSPLLVNLDDLLGRVPTSQLGARA
jgi:hypothetical protein